MKYVENLYDWAINICNEFYADSDKLGEVCDTDTGITIVYDLRTGESAFSKCKKGEEFSSIIGTAVAYARLQGYEVPRVLQKTLLKNLVAGDEFALSSSPKNTFYVVGINPLKPTETIVVNKNDGDISRFKDDYEVYKIN